MKLTIKNNSLREALGIVTKVTGAEHANLYLDGKDIYISATGSNKTVKWLVQGEVDEGKAGQGFGFNVYTLQNLIAGRDDIQLELIKSKCEFSSKGRTSKLKGDFQTIPFEDLTIHRDAEMQELRLTAMEMQSLQEAIAKVSITNLFGNEALNLFVTLNKDGLQTTVYDIHHLAYLHNPKIASKKELAFSLPLPLFQSIGSLVKNADYTLAIGPNFILATGVGFEISIPTMQGLSQQSFEQALSLINSLQKSKDHVKLRVSDLQTTLTNLGSINDGSASVILSESNGRAKFTMKSGYGTVTEVQKAQTKLSQDYMLSPHLLQDILNVYPADDIEMIFNKNQMIVDTEQKEYRAVYVCVLK